MNAILAAVAIAVTLGAVLAVSARGTRGALVGLAVVLGAAPFLNDAQPALSTLAVRVIGAALAAWLLRSASAAAALAPEQRRPSPGASDDPARGGSRLGWPAEALLASAAWVIGAALAANLGSTAPAGPGAPVFGLLEVLTPSVFATATGCSAIVLGLVPTFSARLPVRTAIGALVLAQGVLLVRTGIAGDPGDLEQLAGVTLLLSIAAAGAALVSIGSAQPGPTEPPTGPVS